MKTSALNAAFATSLARGLVEGGLRHVVASPGSRSTPLLLALRACPELSVRVVLDERAAGFFALGLARATGRAVALLCTSGSAGAHYLPAAIEADRSRVPLLVLTADRPPELQGCGAPQTIDQARLLGTHARWFRDPGPPTPGFSPRWVRALAAQALDAAEGGGGVAHLNLPLREPLWDPRARYVEAPPQRSPRTLRGTARLDPAALATLARLLAGAPRGVVVCGPRAVQGTPEDELEQAAAIADLARRLGWPLLAEPTSGLRLGEHDLEPVIASGDALLRDPAFARAHRPERVLRFGQAPTSKPLTRWLADAGRDRTVLVAPQDDWQDPVHGADVRVVAAAAPLCRDLLPTLPRPQDPAWLAAWRRADERAQEALAAACAQDDVPWEGAIARALVEALAAAAPGGALLHVASSMPVRDLDGFAPRLARRVRVLASRGANGIDGTLATALGEAAGWPGPAALLTGDLAFLHDLGGLAAASGLGADLTVVVVDNGGGGIFEYLPIARHPSAFEEGFLTPQPADRAGLTRAAGATWERVETLSGLRAALAASLDRAGGLRVIEVPVERRLNVARHEEAWASVARAWSQEEVPCPSSG